METLVITPKWTTLFTEYLLQQITSGQDRTSQSERITRRDKNYVLVESALTLAAKTLVG